MLDKVLRFFGVRCRHRHLSHPFAAAGRAKIKSDDWDTVSETGGHYVVCLDCGRKFQYDWANMRVMW
ncbi:MAG: hypothetical protein ACE14L_11515 [Terriglobales bacterium]